MTETNTFVTSFTNLKSIYWTDDIFEGKNENSIYPEILFNISVSTFD